MIKVELSLKIQSQEWSAEFAKMVEMPCHLPVGSMVFVAEADTRVTDIWWHEGCDYVTYLLEPVHAGKHDKTIRECIDDMASRGWSVEE